jgi:pyridoxamine 5'-phosphate oxidase
MEEFNERLVLIRKEYLLAELDEKTVEKNPIKQFDKWFKEALLSEVNDPNAMALGTATPDGKPSVRIVLLKEYDRHGFVFYTNYDGRKGRELAENPWSALTFFWPELQRQVRIEGKSEKVTARKSDRYFQTRPKGSQIGAIASPQSEIIGSRKELEVKYQDVAIQYENQEIKRPANWGGYILIPFRVEFWQGRLNRLHDRILYEKIDNSHWEHFRLAP